MHLTRSQVSRKLPISRKGTKYVARASNHVGSGVPVVVAIRDMLGFAKTSKEVKHMINNKLIKINERGIKDVKECIRLFGILTAGKNYELNILPTGRFKFEETSRSSRFCKVIGKKQLKEKKIQLNLHDGSNVILSGNGKENVKVGCTVELGFDGKIKNILQVEKGKNVFIISGRNLGLKGKIQEVSGKKVKIKFKDIEREVELDTSHIMTR